MMEGLRRVLGPDIMTADVAGFSCDFMEAQAFAYLATRRLRELPATFPRTTGAPQPVVGGVVVSSRPLKNGG
jgi:anhydro-N-acetylmuramic acid kinase